MAAARQTKNDVGRIAKTFEKVEKLGYFSEIMVQEKILGSYKWKACTNGYITVYVNWSVARSQTSLTGSL